MTPGRWYIKDQGGNSVLILSDADSACNINPSEPYQVAEVFNAGPECLQEECRQEAQGNARVIAVAPDLLVSLEWALRHVRHLRGSSQGAEEFAREYNQAQERVKRAKGQG